ncbi:MAG: AlpA family phage regulatory protein [Deltaproteobacteria bacterium]|nr:AlpA family phage regulatory protein [Deltaproteobacteria bacterium]
MKSIKQIRQIILQSDGRGRHPITEVTGYSIQSIHRLERQGKFPTRIQLSGGGKVGWYADEIATYQEQRARGPLPAPHRDAA